MKRFIYGLIRLNQVCRLAKLGQVMKPGKRSPGTWGRGLNIIPEAQRSNPPRSSMNQIIELREVSVRKAAVDHAATPEVGSLVP
jgi:hypothetical protein